MDKLTKNGITQESEWRDYGPSEPVSDNPMDVIRHQQEKADHKCPRCGEWTFGFGSCSRCGATWEPPLYG